MSSDKLVELQHQFRNNADDLQDFIRDLGSWQKEMEAKDNQLKMSRTAKAEKADGKSPKEEDKSSKNSEAAKSGKTQGTAKLSESDPAAKKIKGSDYAAWDKFNVEEALGEDGESDESEEDDSEDEEQFLIQQAIVEKDKGNEFFKKGDFKSAVDCYTKGIQCDPSNPMLPANRAMALLKTGQTAAAEADCTLAISLDPTYVKAIHRRATARAALKRFPDAISDFEKVLQLEPGNKVAKLELEKLKQQVESAKQQPKPVQPASKPVEPVSKPVKPAASKPIEKLEATSPQDFEQNLKASFLKPVNSKKSGSEREQIYPVDKKPHQRSKKPVHRIEIVDVDSDADSVVVPDNIVGVEGKKLSDYLSPAEDKASTSNASSKIEIISSTESVEVKSPKVEELPEVSDTRVEKNASEGLQKKIEEEIMQDIADKRLKTDGVDVAMKFKKPPKTSVQFLSDWKELATPESRSKYVRLLQDPARDYQKIFKHAMESDIFDALVDLFSSPELFDTAEVCRHLLGICRVPRISTLVMFLDSGRQQQLRSLVDANVHRTTFLSESEKKEIDQKLK